MAKSTQTKLYRKFTGEVVIISPSTGKSSEVHYAFVRRDKMLPVFPKQKLNFKHAYGVVSVYAAPGQRISAAREYYRQNMHPFGRSR